MAGVITASEPSWIAPFTGLNPRLFGRLVTALRREGADPVRGRRWADHRRTLEAIAWKYRTCSPWRDLPGELGSFKTAHKRLLRWAEDGTWERIFAALLATADAEKDIGWTVSVDSTINRAHQHAAGARKRGCLAEPNPAITRSDAHAAG